MDHSFGLLFLIFTGILIPKGVTRSLSVIGSTVELKCQHRATSKYTLKWVKGKSNELFSVNGTVFVNTDPDIKRRVAVTGNHIVGEFHLSISDVRKADAGNYQCAVGSNTEEHQLTVIEGPQSVSISNKTKDKLVGIEDDVLAISCTAVGGEPAPDMVLQIRNQNYTKSSARAVHHTIPKVGRSYHGIVVKCIAGYQSISFSPVTDTATIDLKLKPSIHSLDPDSVVTVETKPLLVTCTSTGGRPKPTVKWTINNDDITTHSTEISSIHDLETDTHTVTSKLTYSVDRNDNRKTLSCGFKNKATRNSYVSVSRKLDVKFSPSVSVDNETFNPGEIPRQISCALIGNPGNYTYFNWQHKSKYGKLIRILGINSTLTLPSVSEEKKYQDTGEYVCTGSNGIKDKDGNTKQNGSGFVTSQAPPVLLSEPNQTILGQVRGAVDIHVNVYSEPTYSSLKWFKGSMEILSFSKYSMTDVPDVMTDSFHGTKVQVDGYKLTLTIPDLEVEDFVNYTLKLANGVGQTVEHLVILMSASPPATPLNFSITEATESLITLQWLPGFDGGHEQTFIVEYRTSGSSSWNTVTVPQNLQTSQDDLQTYALSGLEDGTPYDIRMYAHNKFNNSEATNIVKISTKEGSGQGAVIGAVVGTLFVFVIVLSIIAIVLLRKRRGGNEPKKIPRSDSDSDGEDGLKDNILYKSVDVGSSKPSEASQSEYTEVQKPSDVYAEVSKPKQQNNSKDKKQKEKKSPGKKKLKSKAINNNLAAEEFANQSEYGNVNNPTGGHKNADGLQYADITFINPPKTKPGKAGKPVIHGLDDRTIYCDVDHSKKAPPLPQEGAYELTDISKRK